MVSSGKKKIVIHTPLPPECAVCTTPRRCVTPALREKKGKHCVGRDDGPDDCDCLTYCGDDPWLKEDKAIPCETYNKMEKEAAANALWNSLKAFSAVWS